MKILISFTFLLFSNLVWAQVSLSSITEKKWILTNQKIEKEKTLTFKEYHSSLIEINTMIWSFEKNGILDYDYQTNSDTFACLGVDFLDLDLDYSSWQWKPNLQLFTLTLKGGYASIDDFILKAEYEVSIDKDENEFETLTLQQTKILNFKNLAKTPKKK
jgi:hypothetical protein